MTFGRSLLATGLAVTVGLSMLTLTGCGDDHEAHDSGAAGGSTPQTTPATLATTAASADADAVDAAFIRQMIPHHQGAVAMAEIAERRAEHDEIKQLAAAITTAQERELKTLETLARSTGVDVAGADAQLTADAETLGLEPDQLGMEGHGGGAHGESLDDADPFDRAFIDAMIPHHEGAIAMAQAQLKRGGNAELKQLSAEIRRAQRGEIVQLAQWKQDWYGGTTIDPAEPTTHSHGGEHG